MFEAVESGPIEVYARELGNNIPRNKVFKNYRGGEFSLRSRDKAADPLLELPAVTTICCKGKQVPTEAAAGLEVAATTTAAAADTTAMDVSHDVVGTADHMSVAMPLESDTTSSEASSEMSTVDNENSIVESPEASEMSSGDGHQNQQAAHLQLGATLHTSKHYFLASDETVFVGTKKYSELFTFWQVKLVMCSIFVVVLFLSFLAGYQLVPASFTSCRACLFLPYSFLHFSPVDGMVQRRHGPED